LRQAAELVEMAFVFFSPPHLAAEAATAIILFDFIIIVIITIMLSCHIPLLLPLLCALIS
jgi:hypothetical protein